MVKILKVEEVGIEVNSVDDFLEKAEEHLKSEEKRKIIAEKTKKLLLNNLGATDRVIDIIKEGNPKIFT